MRHRLLTTLFACLLALPAWGQAPYTIFGNATPKTAIDPDTGAVTLGVKFTSAMAGNIIGVRFYRARASSTGYTAGLYSATGTRLARASVAHDTCSVPCWEQVNFATPAAIGANTRYVAAYWMPHGGYPDDQGGLLSSVSNPPLTALSDGSSGGDGVYRYGSGLSFPTSAWNASNYYVDVAFTAARPPQQVISSIGLSNRTVGANQPAGTVVGQASIVMSPTTPTFSGALTTPGTDPYFSMSGNQLVTSQPLGAGTYNTSIIATQSGISDSPFAQGETITVSPQQAIASIGLSGSSFAGGAPSGTVIGNVSVAMSPASPAFSGSLSLSGADAASFQLAGMTLETNGVVPAGTYHLNVVATESGISNSPFLQAEVITGTAGSADCGLGASGALCDATNTGIAGRGLTSADLTPGAAGNTTADGQQIYRQLINGDVCIVNNSVTIQESQINGSIFIGRRNACSGSGDVVVTGTLVEDTTINPNGGLEGINDINGVNSIFRRNDLCCTENYFTLWTGTNDQILSNYGHDERSSQSAPHYDGIEMYCWANGVTIRNNSIYLTQSNGATAPLNITPEGCTPTGQLLAEYNVLRSQNSAYVILMDNTQGGVTPSAVFNYNKLWPTPGGGYFYVNGGNPANYTGTGNTDYNTGACVQVPAGSC